MKVEIYGAESCNFCKLAVDVAKKYDLDYEYFDASIDIAKFSNLFPGAGSVPQVLINNEWVGGYKDFLEVVEAMQ